MIAIMAAVNKNRLFVKSVIVVASRNLPIHQPL